MRVAEHRVQARPLDEDARAGPGARGDAGVERGPRRRGDLAAPREVDDGEAALAARDLRVAFAGGAGEHHGEIGEERRDGCVEHEARVDGDDLVRARRAVAEAKAAALDLDEEPRPRAVSDRRGGRVANDGRDRRAGRGVGDRRGHHRGVSALLRGDVEVHPVAAAAGGDVRASGLHAIGGALEDADHPPLRGLFVRDRSRPRRARPARSGDEDDLAALEPADPVAPGGEAVDAQGRRRHRHAPALRPRLAHGLGGSAGPQEALGVRACSAGPMLVLRPLGNRTATRAL